MYEEMMEGQSCKITEIITPLPANPVVAMAYVPYQKYGEVYAAEKGLETGTIFPELDKPFLGAGRGAK